MGEQRMINAKDYTSIKVKLINCDGNKLANDVYKFGRLSHDYNEVLPEEYDAFNPDCIKLINKIIEGTTLPKYALEGHRLDFEIDGISRICLAQLTRDKAIFASSSTGVYPLTQKFVLPMSILKNKQIMRKLNKAQWYLEEAYILAAEAEIPSIEARYIGLHCQTISLTASYLPSDFVRSCYSRTSSNFCDECNYVYRLMYNEVRKMIHNLTDPLSIKLWNWLITEDKCINDNVYKRERLFNSDFTTIGQPINTKTAINDWRKSGWKEMLEWMADNNNDLLTIKEFELVREWQEMEKEEGELPTTYDRNNPESLVNAIKKMPWYYAHKKEKNNASRK